jgi:hypothetical protein
MHITPIPSYRSLPEALYPIGIVFDCDTSIPRVCVHRGYIFLHVHPILRLARSSRGMIECYVPLGNNEQGLVGFSYILYVRALAPPRGEGQSCSSTERIYEKPIHFIKDVQDSHSIINPLRRYIKWLIRLRKRSVQIVAKYGI